MGWLWLAAAALLVVGCSQPQTAQESTGSVQLVAVIQSATADEVTRVLVTVMAPDMDPATGSLVKTGSTWSGNLTSIPVGSNRTFTAEAFDATGKKLYSGQSTGVTISAGATAVVNITLQETTPKPGFENDAPRITSLVASTNRVTMGGTVSLQVSAMDPNTGDTLSYAWTASAGSLDNPTSTATTWTAPSVPGSATVTVTVTDSHGASAALSVTLFVEGAGGGSDGGMGGGASVGALFNTWPQVTRVTASPSFLAAGETTTVAATASDLDGDSLSYQWSSPSCFGTWTDQGSRVATFTPSEFGIPPPSPDGCSVCPLQVVVTDGRGGQTTGTLRMCVGNKPSPSFPPRITSTSQSAASVAAGSTVTFRVTATDPMGGALSFQWNTIRGTLGAPVSGVASSEVVWTAPSCVPSTSSTVRILATAKTTAGLFASTPFAVNLTGPSCPPSTWSSVGSLGFRRASHTATLLPSGQVLVVGGYDSPSYLRSAELYDPATGLWLPTGQMGMARTGHSSTRLASGKVLVVGGVSDGSYAATATAELYDPATGAWTPVASMNRGRAAHSAVLLPSGKVLVSGGFSSGMGMMADAELYDPATNTWTPAGNMFESRDGHSSVLLPTGKVLVTGSNSRSSSAELYDPGTGTWSSISLLQSYAQPVMAVLPTGKVLVADLSFSRSAELYDPVAGTLVLTSGLSSVRDSGKVAVLPSGKVLVMGGIDPSSGINGYFASAELYDPATGSWSSAGSMSIGRGSHTATVLTSGEVLVVGGWFTPFPGSGDITPSAELYQP
ncbi:branched-chain amino acid ABC transporter substrate-binding protein [Vitiosangium sp. GDMCC 1.1324]|nr:branched-chain amino acid ABC transporter substrate-binding protein [Vitiosangium sp. GDMCC 1.1324]